MMINFPLQGQLKALRRLWKEAFGDSDSFLDHFEKTAFSKNRCLCATINEEVAAALYWFDCQYEEKPIAYLYAIATAKKFRGQGICHKLMEHTHELLQRSGYEGALLVPGSQSLFDFYKSMGYQTCSHIREFTCTAAPDSVSISSINADEYARLRQQFLPPYSVLQEKENLCFLETQANFYKGEDFLLTLSKDENNFQGIELLGNETAAPKILNSLGYHTGMFRTPGNEKAFAMYLPLGENNIPAPSYFGFAFD